MTTEQRILIDIADVLSIEYTCGHCQTKYLTPIKKFDRVIHQCPNCKEALITSSHADSAKCSDNVALHNFVQALRDLQGRNIGIKLEISQNILPGVTNGS